MRSVSLISRLATAVPKRSVWGGVYTFLGLNLAAHLSAALYSHPAPTQVAIRKVSLAAFTVAVNKE